MSAKRQRLSEQDYKKYKYPDFTQAMVTNYDLQKELNSVLKRNKQNHLSDYYNKLSKEVTEKTKNLDNFAKAHQNKVNTPLKSLLEDAYNKEIAELTSLNTHLNKVANKLNSIGSRVFKVSKASKRKSKRVHKRVHKRKI